MSGKLSKNQAKKAGEFLVRCDDPFGDDALSARLVVDEWREAHKEVFLKVPEILKDVSYAIDSGAVVVSRLKRMDTIVGKLRRPGLNMKLNEMCDIVGCRIIANDVEAVKLISLAIEGRLNVKPKTGVKDAIRERSPLVPGTPSSEDELRREIFSLNNDLFAIEKLRACSDSVTIVSQKGRFSGDALCLMVIDYEVQKTDLFVYDTVDEVEANQMYAKREKMKKGLQDVLLVRVASLKALNEAYPNYSTDIAYFLTEVDKFLNAEN